MTKDQSLFVGIEGFSPRLTKSFDALSLAKNKITEERFEKAEARSSLEISVPFCFIL